MAQSKGMGWKGFDDLPVASVNVSVKNFAKKANHYEGKLIVKNPGQYLAAAIALTLRNAKTDGPFVQLILMTDIFI